MNAPLELYHINKSFKNQQVVKDVSLSINRGEIFGLIGLNGVGKTTLIKIILDLLRADSGSATIFGEDVIKPDSRRNICYLPEKFAPSQFLTGEEFISLSLAYFKQNYKFDAVKKLADTLEFNSKVLGNKISKYSKGMGQKIGLISVLLSQAGLLILDEPMSGLDPTARIALKELMREYVTNGNTIFFSSHILADIDEICDRIAIIHNATLIFVGSPTELKSKYDTDNLEKAFIKAIAN
jgi:ABC-2 type transport system ATP-binding protein